ncbi:MAG: phytanoyl-CoA dioxygenase family protein [Acidobacteriota bacterium]|nr:phytanoyl-CoA dioxygenase family protein [Acidobacteriota bacterium]
MSVVLKGEAVNRQWDERGFVVVPRLLDAARVAALRALCDRVWQQWLVSAPDQPRAANATNMAFLTEPCYFVEHRSQLTSLLSFIAADQILDLLTQLGIDEPLFHNTQFFFEPRDETRAGDWHRDQQFGAPDEATEQRRMQQHTGIHLHVALVPDDHLEIVPGTHARWDTPEELSIRKGLHGQRPDSPHMPGAVRISLDAGDAVFFSAWSIHRGRYVAGQTRRTFDAIYGAPSEFPAWYTPPPTCFLEPHALDDLAPRARAFFQRFIDTYRERWLAGQYDH